MKITMLNRKLNITEEWTVDELLKNLNSDIHKDWPPYDESDWELGWNLFGDPNFQIVGTNVLVDKRNLISNTFNDLYLMLQEEEGVIAEECLGHVAQAKAVWEGDEGSVAE